MRQANLGISQLIDPIGTCIFCPWTLPGAQRISRGWATPLPTTYLSMGLRWRCS